MQVWMGSLLSRRKTVPPLGWSVFSRPKEANSPEQSVISTPSGVYVTLRPEYDVHSERSCVCTPPLKASLCVLKGLSPYTRYSYAFIRGLRIALYERLVSPYTRYSFRSNRDAGYGRDKHFIQDWRDSLSNAGETRYPMLEKYFIQGWINPLYKADVGQ